MFFESPSRPFFVHENRFEKGRKALHDPFSFMKILLLEPFLVYIVSPLEEKSFLFPDYFGIIWLTLVWDISRAKHSKNIMECALESPLVHLQNKLLTLDIALFCEP
jgi:hypothetical protein